MSSERVCQFFLRGRCQRAKCEFLHPADRASAPGGARTTTTITTAMAAPKPLLPPGIVPEKRPGFDSDDEVRPDSDDESIVSGFTEAPKKPPPKQVIILSDLKYKISSIRQMGKATGSACKNQ